MREELVEVFCEEYTKHLNMLNNQKNAAQWHLRTELDSLGKERVNLIQAIKDGIAAFMVKDDLTRVSECQETLKVLLETQPVSKPLLHPAMASRFQRSVMDLAGILNQEDGRAEASEHLRGLVDKVVLTPKADEDGLTIDLYGDLAGILNMAAGANNMKDKTTIVRLEHYHQ